MILLVKVIWHLLNLCAIAFAWNVQGSTGFSVFASKGPISSLTSVEEQNHGYTPSAAPFLKGSFVQPPLTPPSPENVHPTVSPTHSAVTPFPSLPFHDTTTSQQSAASPKPLASLPPELPLHDIAPQKPTQALAPTPSQANVPINVPNPASSTVPLPPVKPHSSVPIPPVNPPSTTYHGSSTSPPAISPSTSSLSPPLPPLHSSVAPPPVPPIVSMPPRTISALSPTHDKTPQHLPSPSPLLQVMHSALPSHDSGSSLTLPPLPSLQFPLPAHIILSPSPEAAPSVTIPEHSSPPLPPTPTLHTMPPISSSPPPDAAPVHGVAPSSPAESHFSAPPRPSAIPPITTPSPVSAPPPNSTVSNPPPPLQYALPLPAPINLSPSPEAAPSHGLAPPPNATIPEHSSPPLPSTPPPHVMPPISFSPPPDSAPHDVAPSSPAESHFSAPPANATNQPPEAVPPTVPLPPLDAAPPSHDLTSSPPAESHFSAPPPDAVPPTVPLPPLDAAPPSHDVASSPPAESHFSAPPPDAVPPTVPLPPLDAAPPSHDMASSPPTESHFSTPPPNPPPNPPPDAVPPTLPLPPLDAAPPSHDVGSPPTESHFPAPPPNSTEQPSASPPTPSVHAPNPPPDAVPPTVLSPPPNAAPPSHDVASSPPTESHFSAPPPNPSIQAPNLPPTVTSPPPNATPPSHDLVSSPPTQSRFPAPPPSTPATHFSNPPAGAVSLPPPHAAPSHELAPSPTFVSHISAPPPSSKHHFSAPPSSGSVKPSHASAPSTTAEPPLTASPPFIHTLPPVISNSSAPVAAPPVRSPSVIPVLPREPPSIAPEAQLPHVSSPAPSIDQRGDPVPVAPSGSIYTLSPTNSPPEQGFSPSTAPSIHKSRVFPSLPPIATSSPPISPTAETAYSPSLSPLPSINTTHYRSNSSHSSPETSYTVPSPSPKQQGHTSIAPASHNPGSSAATAPAQSPLIEDYISPVPMLTLPVTPGHAMTPPFFPPEISPPTSEPIIVLAPPMLALPPPPPNQDCLSYTCLDPYTNTIPGSPCGCVLPMRVELRIDVALYTFFPLVPEFAREIATSIFIKQSQVRVLGANAASDKPDKTLLLMDLVPLNDKFDNITAFLIFERFWNHQVDISKTLFGDYQVLYVQYPGLPASPPMAPSDIAAINGGPYPGENGSKINPLGVDVTKQRRKHRLSGSLIAIIVFSAVGALLMFILLGWILLFRHRRQSDQSAEAAHVHPSSIARSTGPTGQSAGSRPSFSLSFESSVAAYSGSAKTFSAVEIERATDNYNPSRVLGEGGFGLVYSATLEDGAEVAVKVLKREDQQGGREFVAEIEMLSRLHHRNLVKLIGICAEEHIHCLIYELIPNGSVESHLHGIDKNRSPLDWASRVKIALGAARGLAYLHEDSSPRVIHRDFKASNILLEADFTPKVSDFGLARTAMDEDNKHISTRVMGTFGYVAPEYAMTGHLLVKSDVYSYGVVLLELLTGRKPVDMSQPSGQENLVAWTRPYLTTKEALKSIIDPNLGPDISFESVSKVAAIASMCVQPEVSHRPFMGEVVQALKLVCNECDDSKDDSSRSTGSENEYHETRDMDVEKALSVSDVYCEDSRSDSFKRGSSSGPIGGGRSWRFWKRGGTASSREDVGGGDENGVYRFWSGSH